jgi:hypothetical protein
LQIRNLHSRAQDLSFFLKCDIGSDGFQKVEYLYPLIIYKKSGTLTLFAFDAGEGLSEHTAPFDAIASIIDGEALRGSIQMIYVDQ